HMLDLIIWLLDGKEYEITDYEIFKTYETKRKGFSDFSGNLKFLINNTICELNDTEDNPTEYIQITTENKTFNIDEPNQKLTETEGDSVMNMDFEVPFQSQLTSEVVKAIIWNGDIMIPDLKQSFLSHKILFEFMEKVDVSGLNIT
ncbi:hypothetical protein HQ529_03150, partial [Candidatus Woesearchaeota archaeon]|nr:hypothetical protein [Candidatus Woesearchaeota archaeon]